MTTQIDNRLIENWDRQIYRYINGEKSKPYYVPGMNFDDLHQELRIVLINAAKKYDEAKSNAKFQTFLNRCFQNHIKNLIGKSVRIQKNMVEIPFMDDIPEVDDIHEAPEQEGQFGISLESEEFLEEVDFSELDISLLNLDKEEKHYLKKRLEGYSYSELETIFGESHAETLKKRLQNKYQNI